MPPLFFLPSAQPPLHVHDVLTETTKTRSVRALQLIVFDFDGLIIDTESAILDAWRDAYDHCGRPFPHDTFQEMIGRADHPFDPWDDILSNGYQFASREELDTRFNRINEGLIAESPVLPGVIERIFEARARNIPVAVASSSSHSWVDRHLRERDLFAHFDLVRCRDDVAHAKPWPDLYFSVLDHFKVPAERAVAFEDSLNGMTAAKKAGMTCIVIPNGTTRTHDFSAADQVLSTLDEIDLDGVEELLSGSKEIKS